MRDIYFVIISILLFIYNLRFAITGTASAEYFDNCSPRHPLGPGANRMANSSNSPFDFMTTVYNELKKIANSFI